MIYLKRFQDHSIYSSSNINEDGHVVSYCKNQDEIHYNSSYNYVEISGVKWATMNIGANNITDTGLYFQWGDTQGYTADQVGDDPNDMRFDWEHYKYGTSVYNMTKYVDGDTLELEDDAAYNNLGSKWRIPSVQDFETLLSSTTHSVVSNYNDSGVRGILFIDNQNSSNKIFFPLSGIDNDGEYNESDHWSIDYIGELGTYWTNKMSENTTYQNDAYAQVFNISSQNNCSLDPAMRSIAACIRPVFVW